MKRLRVLTVTTMIALLGWTSSAQASPITYTATSIASGALGGTTFTDALITVSLTADTSGAFEPDAGGFPGFFLNVGTATVTIAGIGTAAFNDPNGYVAFAFPAIPDEEIFVPAVGIAQFDDMTGESFTHILALSDPLFAGYDLTTSIGPITGPGFGLVPGTSVVYSTTLGTLAFDAEGGGDPVTFEAMVVAEPASLSLVALGGLGTLAARRRARAANRHEYR